MADECPKGGNHDWSNWEEEYTSDSHVHFVRQCVKCWTRETKG